MDETNTKEQVKQRVLAVIEHEQLTDAQFAEAIGISRGAVSQIKSGRSYPSLDVALKILERFPTLSSDWLLLGKGEMYKHDEPSSSVSQFAENPFLPEEASVLNDNRSHYGVNYPQNTPQPAYIERVVCKETPSKSVEKIVIFYSDSTFDTFVLEKKEE